MDLLFNTETVEYRSFFYKLDTQVPNLSYKIRINVSRQNNISTKIDVLEGLTWKLLFESDYRELPISPQPDLALRSTKFNEFITNLYKLLCQ